MFEIENKEQYQWFIRNKNRKEMGERATDVSCSFCFLASATDVTLRDGDFK